MNFFKFNNRTAVLQDDGTAVSYKDLVDFSMQVGRLIGTRCLAFILCRNVIGSLASYVACLDNKIVPLLLDASLADELYSNLQDTYKPQYIFMPVELAKASDHVIFEKNGYVATKTNFDECYYPLNDDLALLLTTSGSTGSPKLVRQSFENIKSNAEAIVEYLGLDDT